MNMQWTGTALTVVGLVATLALRHGTAALAAKMVASTGFLTVAVAAGALQHRYGLLVLAGLAGCWLGDLCLALPGQRFFLAGLVAFLLGHVAFAAAFAAHGVAWRWTGAGALALVAVAIPVLCWLYPHVPGEMRVPVGAYILVISAMVALAAGARGTGAPWLLFTGAVLFYVSDIFVARDRFVAPGFINRLVGLPLYYAGVWALAATAGTGIASRGAA